MLARLCDSAVVKGQYMIYEGRGLIVPAFFLAHTDEGSP